MNNNRVRFDRKNGMKEKPITTPKRLVHNTLFNVITLVTNAIIGFFMIRFFLGRLGETGYGVWMLIGGFIFRYSPLLNMGLSSAINRYIPVYLATKNDLGIKRVVSTSFYSFLMFASALVVISIVLYFNVESWFEINPELVQSAKNLALIVGFCFAISMPLQLYTAVLSGLQRYDIINLVTFTSVLLRTGFLLVMLSRGYGLLTMGFAYGLSEIALRILQFHSARKLLPQMAISTKYIDFKLLRAMLAYGINTLMYTMGAIVIYHASNLVIGVFMGTAEISQFTIAVAGILLLAQLLQAFTAAIKPAVSDLDARDANESVKQIAFLTQKYSLLLIIPGACFLIAMGREFLWVWVGEKLQDPAAINTMGTILAILTVGHSLRLAQHSNFLVLVGRGRHRIFGILTAFMALLCLLASVISVKVFNLGLLGIAWSNFLPMFLISGAILPAYFNWKMKISATENITRVWTPAVKGALPTVVMIILWKYIAGPDSWLEIILVFLAMTVLTMASAWLFSLNDFERKHFLHIALRKKDVD